MHFFTLNNLEQFIKHKCNNDRKILSVVVIKYLKIIV